MTETYERLRSFLESLTDDSRPCRPGCCPLVAAGIAMDNADATTLSPALVHRFDDVTRNLYGALQWHQLTVADMLRAMGL